MSDRRQLINQRYKDRRVWGERRQHHGPTRILFSPVPLLIARVVAALGLN
jgi:hypothetical protein